MPLSKLTTLATLRSDIRELSKEVSEDKVQNPAINRIINYNILDLCELLNGATQPDYGETANLSDAGSSVSSTIVTGQNYTNGTRLLGGSVHGFTSADIGRTVVYWNGTTWITIAQIESISATTSFVVTKAAGSSAAGTVSYSVLPFHSASYLDLSSLKYDKLIKLVDSVNGLVPLKKAFEIENITNLVHNVTETFAYHEGERIYIVKGSSVANWGTLTLHYYRLPQMPSADGDYIDIKDKYMRLLLDKCVVDVFALAKMDAPSQLQTSVDSRTEGIRKLNQEKEASLRTRQRD